MHYAYFTVIYMHTYKKKIIDYGIHIHIRREASRKYTPAAGTLLVGTSSPAAPAVVTGENCVGSSLSSVTVVFTSGG